MPLPITAPFKVHSQMRTETKNNIRLVPTGGDATNADRVGMGGPTADTIELIGVANDVIQALTPGTVVTVTINI